MAQPAYTQRLSCGSLAPLQLTGTRGCWKEARSTVAGSSHSASAPSLAQLDALWHFDCVVSPRSPAATAAVPIRHRSTQSSPPTPAASDRSSIRSPPVAASSSSTPSAMQLPAVGMGSPTSPCTSSPASFSRFAPGATTTAAVLQRVFSTFDENGDGCVSIHEISNVLERLGLPASEYSIQSLLARLLSESQGHVNEQEFVQLYERVCSFVEGGLHANASSPSIDAGVDEDLLAAFHVFDKDGNGFISPRELQSVLCSLGFEQARDLEACVNMIARVDENGDGQVDFLEFKKLFHLQHPFDVVMETSIQSF